MATACTAAAWAPLPRDYLLLKSPSAWPGPSDQSTGNHLDLIMLFLIASEIDSVMSEDKAEEISTGTARITY